MVQKKVAYAVVILVIIVGAAVAGWFIYQYSLQPNIEVTATNIAQPSQDPITQIVLDSGRVSSYGTFTYTATAVGTYTLVFDNSFSFFSDKSVSVTYAINDSNQSSQSFSVPAGTSRSLDVQLNSGQKVSGSLTVSGGSGNDVGFGIIGHTCSESVVFSGTLVNPGTASGFATISLQVDGNSAWSNKFFVQNGQQVPVSGSVTVPDCSSHNFDLVVTQQQKA